LTDLVFHFVDNPVDGLLMLADRGACQGGSSRTVQIRTYLRQWL